MLGIRLFLIGILTCAVVSFGVYVMKLRSDNAILKANAVKNGRSNFRSTRTNHTTKRRF